MDEIKDSFSITCDCETNNKKVPLKLKGKLQDTSIRSMMVYGTKEWVVKGQQ